MSCPFCFAHDHGSADECRRLTAELADARARIAELEAKLRATETPAQPTAPTSDPFDFDLRTWDPGNHGTPGGVGP